MALVIKDRVQETATAVTTVSFTLLGAVTGYQSFSTIGNTNTVYYAATDASGNWEVGTGTWATGGILTRTTILSSSNAGAAVTFSGTVTVFGDYPAGKAVYQDANGIVTVPGFVANESTTGSASQGAFAYGTLSYSDVNHLATFQTSINSYAQVEIQNTNAGASASADHVVGNNNTTATTYYGDFGMNSSGWAGSGAFNTANMVYLTSTTGDLAIGTTTANAIHFVVNNGATDAATISSTGVFTLATALGISSGGTNSTATPTAGGAGYGTGTAYAYTAAGTSGNALISAGASAPAFGNLAIGTANTNVSGALTVTNGGTGASTLTGILVGNGTSAVTTVTAPSGTIVGTTDTQTLTNKRITPRAVTTSANSATPTINTDNTDIFVITGQSVAITSFTTNLSGTPTNGQKLWIAITGTTAIALTWGASFEASTQALPTTTITTGRLDVGFVWNVATTKWRCVAAS